MDLRTESEIEIATFQTVTSLIHALTRIILFAFLSSMVPAQGMDEVAGRVVVAAGEISAAGEAGATEEDEGEGGESIVGEEGEITGEAVEVGVDGEGRARVEDNRCLCCACCVCG